LIIQVIHPFDLTRRDVGMSDWKAPVNSGEVTLSINFAKATTVNIIVLVLLEYEKLLKFNAGRQWVLEDV